MLLFNDKSNIKLFQTVKKGNIHSPLFGLKKFEINSICQVP